MRETCAKAAAHAKSQGVAIERLAIQYAFQKPNVSTVLIGMATPDEVCFHPWLGIRPSQHPCNRQCIAEDDLLLDLIAQRRVSAASA